MGDRAPEREANGLNHLCLEVDSIDAAVAELEGAGVPLISPKKRGADGNMQAWVEDPDGNRIELMEMAKRLHAGGRHRTAARARVMTAQMRAGPA